MIAAGTSPVAADAARLPTARRLGWGVGNFAFNMYFMTASLLLLFYYTDVLGLPPATAGWVFAVALVWDAVFDPIIGVVANRTRTRWGRYRPYLLFGALPLAASWALIFLPTRFEGAALVVFAVAAHILFRTLYALVNMPYLAMSATITRDSHERGVLAAFGLVAGAVSTVVTSLATLKLVALFGGGQPGFFRVALLYGGIATAVLLVVFLATEEQAAPADEPRPPVAAMVRALRANRAFWIVSAASLLTAFSSTFFQKTLPYFFKYGLLREDLIPAALGVLALSVALSIPLWNAVARRWSKRAMWLAGTAVGLVGAAMMWALSGSADGVLLALAPTGVGVGASYLGFWSMMPDTVEYGEWRSRVRAEGAIFGFVLLIQKAGLGLAAAAVGETLAWIGYRANAAQTPATLEGIRVTMIALPAVLNLLAGLVIVAYPITGDVHRRMVRVIERRRARATRVGGEAVR